MTRMLMPNLDLIEKKRINVQRLISAEPYICVGDVEMLRLVRELVSLDIFTAGMIFV